MDAATIVHAGAQLVVRLPLRIRSESNLRDHWRRKAARVKIQRSSVWWALYHYQPPPLPLRITLTRIAPLPLDDDNCIGGCKAVRDGISDWLCGTYGKGDDRQPGLTWAYAQRRGASGDYGIEILIEEICPHA